MSKVQIIAAEHIIASRESKNWKDVYLYLASDYDALRQRVEELERQCGTPRINSGCRVCQTKKIGISAPGVGARGNTNMKPRTKLAKHKAGTAMIVKALLRRLR